MAQLSMLMKPGATASPWASISRLRLCGAEIADADDAVAADRHVAGERLAAAAVVDRAAANDHVGRLGRRGVLGLGNSRPNGGSKDQNEQNHGIAAHGKNLPGDGWQIFKTRLRWTVRHKSSERKSNVSQLASRRTTVQTCATLHLLPEPSIRLDYTTAGDGMPLLPRRGNRLLFVLHSELSFGAGVLLALPVLVVSDDFPLAKPAANGLVLCQSRIHGLDATQRMGTAGQASSGTQKLSLDAALTLRGPRQRSVGLLSRGATAETDAHPSG